MPRTAADATASPTPPPLGRDPAYHGINLTQFLGAFNDNLFKQLVLLICVSYGGERDYQMFAQGLFALPFVLFSGFAGFLADRFSKQRIVVSMKLAEIAVMTAGFFAFHATFARLAWLLAVVFLMGTHSAFFGPSKYGILPELFRESDLPLVNGMIQMTTFLAIICGAAMAGFTDEWFADRLWVGSAVCIGIAVAGTLTSLLVRRTPAARPGLPLSPSALFLSRETWRMIRTDRPLFQALLVSSLFWFLGGVVHPSVNAFGKTQLHYGSGRTSVMVACMAIGIMVGCLWAGRASKGRIRFGFVMLGAWGIIACLCGISLFGATQGSMKTAQQSAEADRPPIPQLAGRKADPAPALPANGEEANTKGTNRAGAQRANGAESLYEMLVPKSLFEWIARGLLIGVGVSAGFFIVPLQVFMQVRPPQSQKGRMIGAMNLINWIGILAAAAFYGAVERLCVALAIRESWIFALSALVMVPVALFYRPGDRHD